MYRHYHYNSGSPVSSGHPLRLRKADIKNTKKCMITDEYITDGVHVIVYVSGISTGVAKFPLTEIGNEYEKKFRKLLER